jgi:hypothetical protein
MPRASWLSVCVMLLAAGCSETFESHYANWQEARKEGMFERGWLPDWLPPSAADIRVIYNLDTNERAFSFSVRPGWSPPEAAGCEPSSQAAAPGIRFRHLPPNIEQLPGILRCGDLFVLVTERDVFAWR